MTIDAEIRTQLAEGDLRGVFLDVLGWDQPGIAPFTVLVDDTVYDVRPLAQKRGLHVLHIPEVPSADAQHRIDIELSQRAMERMLVFSDAERQVWRWPEPRKSGGIRLVAQESPTASPSPALVQRLAGVAFTLAEEDSLTLPQVKDRVRVQFNADRVTDRFYTRFETQHTALRDGIEGLDDDDLRRWYASLLMNRLMFIYFLQKKGFLNGDRDYLRTCLAAIRRLRGPDEFYAFYRELLLPLFHYGFGSHTHPYEDPEIAAILGDIPYVNGGIFEEHELEAEHAIRVPDREFESIFDFFDSFTWHLDDRPHGDPDAINPDVIGYIFERYINLTSAGQRQDGAYYTKEDVTGYMVSATLVPRLLDRIVDTCEINPFLSLVARPTRYVSEAMLHGRGPNGEWLDAPALASAVWPHPEAWVELTTVPHDAVLQLPDESWVETLDRRDHVDVLIAAIANGEITTIDDLISNNLDARTLLADVIHQLDSARDIATVWREITATTIIDPTCGSGAFLFAALDVLDEVYAALLERARTHLATGSADAQEHVGELVADADKHPNDAYYRRKHAALHNLFGVDIMREAIETAKLRLFLALASKLQSRSDIEPLPDLDFNLRAGNLLVGFLDVDDARERAAITNLAAAAAVEAFLPRARHAAELREAFLNAQTADDPGAVLEAKSALAAGLEAIRRDADEVLAAAEAVPSDSPEFDSWWERSLPFHWFLEYAQIIAGGGFDVVIGNPPYVKRRSIAYDISGFATADLPDIYAPCMERALSLLNRHGRFAMILPISFQFSDRHRAAREVALRQGTVWVSTYSRNPSALFTAGLGVRNAILVTSSEIGKIHTTATRRWWKEARDALFPTTRYASLPDSNRQSAWLPRTGDEDVSGLLHELKAAGGHLGQSVNGAGAYPLGFKVTALYYLAVYLKVPPVYTKALQLVVPPKDSAILFATEEDRLLAYALLAGELALVWWMSTGDDFDVTASTLKETPIGLGQLAGARAALLTKARELDREAHREANLLFTPYAKLMTGIWDLRRVRPITRAIDRMILEELGLTRYHAAVLRATARFAKSTGERPGTERGTAWLPGAAG